MQSFLQKIETCKVVKIFLVAFLFLPIINNADDLLNGPQKIVKDVIHNRLLVSNGNNSRLVVIDSTGHQDYFLPTVENFVDGLEVVGDTVYGVGNDRYIRGYNLTTKEKVVEFRIPGESGYHLSSITSDSSGHLFISSPPLHTIYKYRISDGAYWVFAKDNGLNQPNGILLESEKNRIVVIGDAPVGQAKIFAVSLIDSTVSVLASTNFKRPDGIIRDRQGSHYVGGYYLTSIYKFDADFSQAPVAYHSASSYVYPTFDPVDNSLLVASYNFNTWTRIPIITDVEESNDILKSFLMFQNYPNPFNSTTTIKYKLAALSNVKIIISNVLGQTVSISDEGLKNAGTYEYKFNADHLSSGIYFNKIIAGNYTETKKMILLK
ncbi:MAG: T9SS type A sorting domain-containing protein [bacterium]